MLRNRKTTLALHGLLLGLALALSACDVGLHSFRLQISDFDSSGVEGVALWRMDGGTGDFGIHRALDLQRSVLPGGEEVVAYTVTLANGMQMEMLALVEREGVDPDAVQLELFVEQPPVGEYKLTTRNAAGDSPLSQATLVL